MSTCVRGGITYKRHTFVNEVCTKCGRAQFLDLDKDDAYEVVSNVVVDESSSDGTDTSRYNETHNEILDTE